MELKIGQRYSRLRIELEGEAYELKNVLVFDALSATVAGRDQTQYIIGIPSTSVPADAVVIAVEAEEDDE